MSKASAHSLVGRLKHLVQMQGAIGSRLPSERSLALQLQTTRAKLRTVMRQLEAEELVWRGVGKGTFVGKRPPQKCLAPDLKLLANPVHVMRARLALEPELAGLAAANATSQEISEIQRLCKSCEMSETWAEYELCDSRLHQAIARAAHNPVLMALVEQLDSLRTTVNLGRKRLDGGPLSDHHSFEEHSRLVEAISSQNPRLASERMRRHLMTVEDRLLGRR